MVLIREYDPFSGHMPVAPVVPVRELVITPLDADGRPVGEPLRLDGTEVSVQFAGPTFGPLPPISTTRPADAVPTGLEVSVPPVDTPPVEPAPQAAVEPPKRKRPRRRRPSAAEVEASIKDMDR